MKKQEIDAAFLRFKPICIKHGPRADEWTIETLSRLESKLTHEVDLWSDQNDFPFANKALELFKSAAANVTGIYECTSIDQVNQRLQTAKQNLADPYCVSHSSLLVSYLKELLLADRNRYQRVVDFVFGGSPTRVLDDLTTRSDVFLAYDKISRDQPKRKPDSTDPDRDLGQFLEKHAEQFIEIKASFDQADTALAQDRVRLENSVNDTIKSTEGKFTALFDKAESEFTTAKETYEKLLSLEAPMGYWKSIESRSMNSTLIWSSVSFVLIVLLVVTAIIAYNTVPSLIVEPTKSYSVSELIKWFILSSLIVSVQIYGLRQSTKIAFSSLHIARDARERRTLAYTFLALNRKGQVSDKEEKEIILNALFSRVDTGLLKGDSSPSFPSSALLEKVFGK